MSGFFWFFVGLWGFGAGLGVQDGQDEYFEILPKVYGVDNRMDCHSGGDIFCESKIQLKPQQNDTKIWRHILESTENPYKFRKDKIYRAVCIPRAHPDYEDYIRQRFNSEVANVTLEVESVKIYNCLEPHAKMTDFQWFFVNGLIIYASFIMFATYYDWKQRQKKTEANRYLVAFSMLHNSDKLRRPITNPVQKKLVSMQGVRTYNTMLVVLGHSLLNYFIMYVANPEFIEYLTTARIKLFLTWGLFLVQPFFMMTGWLLMVFCHQQWDKMGKLNARYMVGVILFRIIRLWPLLIGSILTHYSGIMKFIFKGSTMFFLENDYQRCQKNWWLTLTFMSSLYPVNEMCNLAAWYLSSDFQIFAACLVAIYVIFRNKLPVIRSLLTVLILALSMQMATMYALEMDVAYKVLPETFLIYNVLEKHDIQLHYWYISALSNAPTFIIGLLFGSIFYQKAEQKYFTTPLFKVLWFLAFFGLPFCAIYISTLQYGRLSSALVGAANKAIYALGVAIGILGMSEGVGGVILKACEWRFAVHLAPTTYGVYLLHIACVFSKALTVQKLEPILVTNMITSSIINIILSFFVGYIASLTVDMPWNNVKCILTHSDPQKTPCTSKKIK